jgi:hypothetical protein
MAQQRTGLKLALGVTGIAFAAAAGAYSLYKQSNHHESLGDLFRRTNTNKGGKASSPTSAPPGAPTMPTSNSNRRGEGGIETKKLDGKLTADEVHRLLEILSSPPERLGPLPDSYAALTVIADKLHM